MKASSQIPPRLHDKGRYQSHFTSSPNMAVGCVPYLLFGQNPNFTNWLEIILQKRPRLALCNATFSKVTLAQWPTGWYNSRSQRWLSIIKVFLLYFLATTRLLVADAWQKTTILFSIFQLLISFKIINQRKQLFGWIRSEK